MLLSRCYNRQVSNEAEVSHVIFSNACYENTARDILKRPMLYQIQLATCSNEQKEVFIKVPKYIRVLKEMPRAIS